MAVYEQHDIIKVLAAFLRRDAGVGMRLLLVEDNKKWGEIMLKVYDDGTSRKCENWHGLKRAWLLF